MNVRKRGLSSEDARKVRQAGHDDALEFALSIGMGKDYQNDQKAKKDVIDLSGDAHSVKSGKKKWQIFLYGINRFKSDDAFGAMNGIGDLLIDCINAFPLDFTKYCKNKVFYKERLREPMRFLKEKLQNKRRLRAFINKSMFNGGEVNYLTVKHNNIFHIFEGTEVVQIMGNKREVCNSTARLANQTSEQKVLFRHKGKNLGEVEMRNDSITHYREIRFNMLKTKALDLLLENISTSNSFTQKVKVYGNANKKFGKWKK